ncbi:MAG: trypsin-like peptidase domain-containing protein [Planctomycetes bacterium]|nr:trypsin-like peptidase domain-containing protein [Planctomycetota bacterium]
MRKRRTRSAVTAACRWSALALAVCGALPGQTPARPGPVEPDAPSAVTAERLAAILAGADPQSTAELLAMQQHVQALLKHVLPATVSLPGASGVLVRRDETYYVLCAAHVTRAAEQRVEVRLTTGERLRGTSLGADHRSDVSLIRIDGEDELPAVEIGSSAGLKRGQWVLMLGHPSGLKEGRAAPARLGRVLRVPERGYLVTDCTMQAGDSGGPLFDMQGRVVGINSRIGNSLANNMHAPIDALVEQWGDLDAGKVTEARRRGRRNPGPGFGVALEFGEGCPVFGDVAEGSAAAAAGLRKGDRLFEIGEIEILDRRSVWRAMRDLEIGSKVTVVVERDGKGIELTLPIVGGGSR